MNHLKTLSDESVTAPDKAAASWSRRSFLVSTAIGVAAATFSASWMGAMASTGIANFHQLSEFLVAKSLDPVLSERAMSALTKVDKDFPTKAKQLQAFIASSGFPTVEELIPAVSFSAELKSTAMVIISSYYLGFAGTPRPGKASDNTQFVTYTQALMYRLTYDYTPIPSYSRWGTGYWAELPKRG